MQWGLSSIRQGENSGTITHELGHFAFKIGDNNNNPYVQPYRRVGSGPWDMMDRGSFNGPGGPHMRWVIPAAMGASMPAGLMLRNRMKNGFVPENQVLTLSREELATTGPMVARITARAVEPLPGTFAGIVIRLDGDDPHDKTPVDDPSVNPLSPGIPNFDFYSIEVVQRIGYDSFCPDNGVLIAKNKDKESRNGGPNGFNCFNWVIDAHPEDIKMVDYYKPDGKPVMRTIADYRQLNDALFHAGLNSGSLYEWEDTPNRLHFYIIDLQKNNEGILEYEVGVISPDYKVVDDSKINIAPPPVRKITSLSGNLNFIINRIEGEKTSGLDNIYRVSVGVEGEGWKGRLLNSLLSFKRDSRREIEVFIYRSDISSRFATVSLTLQNESDTSKVVTSSFRIKRGRRTK